MMIKNASIILFFIITILFCFNNFSLNLSSSKQGSTFSDKTSLLITNKTGDDNFLEFVDNITLLVKATATFKDISGEYLPNNRFPNYQFPIDGKFKGTLFNQSFDIREEGYGTDYRGFLKVEVSQDLRTVKKITIRVLELTEYATTQYDIVLENIPLPKPSGHLIVLNANKPEVFKYLTQFTGYFKSKMPVFDSNGKEVDYENYEERMIDHSLKSDEKWKLQDIDGISVLINLSNIPEKKTVVNLIDNETKIIKLESGSNSNTEFSPKVQFEFEKVDWEKLQINTSTDATQELIFKYDLILSGVHNDGTDPWERKIENAGSRLLDSRPRYKITGNNLTFYEPLYEILTRTKDNPYSFLINKHFLNNTVSEIPQAMTLNVTIKPKEIYSMMGTPPKKRSIELSHCQPSSAKYLLGWEIDPSSEMRLKLKKENWTDWEDGVEIKMTLTKMVGWFFGYELPLDIVDVGIEIYHMAENKFQGDWEEIGEGLVDIAATLLPAPLEFIFTSPEAYKTYKEEQNCLAPKFVQREIKDKLKKLGYLPVEKLRASSDLTLWVNLSQEKLAFIDRNGIIHRMKRPKGYNVSAPYFTVTKAQPFIGQFQVFPNGRKGKNPKWQWHDVREGEKLLVIPPAKKFEPMTVSIWHIPGTYNPGTPYVETLWITTAKGGQLLLSEDGMLDFGWMDDPQKNMVLRKPYVGLISGKLEVVNAKDKIGIDFFKLEDKKTIRFTPRAWIQPEGTHYIVKVNPSSGNCKIDVLEGSVKILDNNEQLIDAVSTNESKTISLINLTSQVTDKEDDQDLTNQSNTNEKTMESLVFSDNFDSENDGKKRENYRGLKNWNRIHGTVNLIKPKKDQQESEIGLCIELQAGKNSPATFQSTKKFKFEPGNYTIEFEISGNSILPENVASVNLGSFFSEKFVLNDLSEFTTIIRKVYLKSRKEGRLTLVLHDGKKGSVFFDNIIVKRMGSHNQK